MKCHAQLLKQMYVCMSVCRFITRNPYSLSSQEARKCRLLWIASDIGGAFSNLLDPFDRLVVPGTKVHSCYSVIGDKPFLWGKANVDRP